MNYKLSFQKISYFVLAITTLFFLQCNKKNDTAIDKVETVDNSLIFNTFILEKKHNPQLEADIVGSIQGNTIVINGLKYFHVKVKPTFTTNAQSVEVNGQNQISSDTELDVRQSIVYTLISAKGLKKTVNLVINFDDKLTQLDIKTKGGVAITSNQTYVEATIKIEGRSIYNNFEGSAQVRGRGNSTWFYPKKPYRFKLDAKTPILGLAAEKDWVLLANYLDGTHTLNAVAMKIGQLLNMPFTNHVIPVELNINGQYNGLYMLTEQVEVKQNRVNIGDKGILLSIDTYYDEPWKFKSAFYQLPVLIKDPEITTQTEIDPIKQEFERLEALIADSNFPKNNYLDFIDLESIANYYLVYLLTDNREINHPKSTFMYKAPNDKFKMGPIWDFDWGFGYEGTNVHFSKANSAFFSSTPKIGTRFFKQIASDPKVKSLIKQKWIDFKATKFKELINYIDDYSFMIVGARNRDYQKWRRGNTNFKNDIVTLKKWLNDRAVFLDTHIDNL